MFIQSWSIHSSLIDFYRRAIATRIMAEIRRRERERGTEARLWKLLRFWSTNLANSLAPVRRRGRKLKKWRPCRVSFNKEPVFVTRRCTQVSPNWILLSRATWTIRFSRRRRVGQRHCQLTDLNVSFLFSCLRKIHLSIYFFMEHCSFCHETRSFGFLIQFILSRILKYTGMFNSVHWR